MAEAASQTPGRDHRGDGATTDRKPAHEAIRRAVLRALGSPADLLRVDVHRLWEHHYRVNVWTGSDVHSARVANTYFITTDETGDVASAIPRIQKEAR